MVISKVHTFLHFFWLVCLTLTLVQRLGCGLALAGVSVECLSCLAAVRALTVAGSFSHPFLYPSPFHCFPGLSCLLSQAVCYWWRQAAARGHWCYLEKVWGSWWVLAFHCCHRLGWMMRLLLECLLPHFSSFSLFHLFPVEKCYFSCF